MAPPPPPTAANAPRMLPDVVEGSSAHPTMADSAETRDGKSLKSAANVSAGERLHSTVRLNQFTLQFEDTALEAAYKAYSHRRKKALWLRSLIPATAFHILFGLSDCLEHPPDHLLVTVPARIFLSVLQISMFILVRWDLVSANETTMLLVSICNGIPTLLLYALQRSSLHQWDALFVVFGLSFYTIPKITPLGFVASLVGSWLTAILYAGLSFLVRPPVRPFESLLGFLYCAPVIGIFNTISYYSEYNSRERFVLRRRLRSESISLAVSRTKTLPSVGSLDRTENVFRANKFILGVLLWGATTLGGWTSLPDVFKFVDEDTGWAWFSHCAGLTMFLLVMTRQLQWLFVVPVIGALLLWMMSLAMPASWIIISAHSMGYGLLFASIVVAMGVFSRFVSVWRELVSFLTRSCFLYPQLQAGLQDEYPLLVKIVSEYTAGMDPAIMSSRDLTNRALTFQAAPSPSVGSPVSPMSTDVTMRLEHQSSISQHQIGVAPQLQASSRSPSRRRMLTSAALGSTELKLTSDIGTKDHAQSQCSANGEAVVPRKVSVESRSPRFEEAGVSEPHSVMCNRMISVLPSFKAGKCFFCTKNEAEHLVPACGMWGKWTHWRLSQQQDIMFGSLALPSSSAGGGVVGKPVQAMCTSYYDVQQSKAELEQRVKALEKENQHLRDAVAAGQRRAMEEATTLAQIQAELRAQEEKHLVERHRNESVLQKKMDQMMSEANHVAHDHKMQLRELEIQNRKLIKELRETSEAAVTDLQAARDVQQRDSEENQRLQAQVQELRQELETLRSSSSLAAGNVEVATPVPSENVTHAVALHPSRRLPYARWIEVEGLRESIRRKGADAAVDETLAWSVGRP